MIKIFGYVLVIISAILSIVSLYHTMSSSDRNTIFIVDIIGCVCICIGLEFDKINNKLNK